MSIEIDGYLVESKRFFSVHHILLDQANASLKRAQAKDRGWRGDAVISIVISAMATEAFVNAVGGKLFSDWEDFERSSLTVRYRHICLKLGIDHRDQVDLWNRLSRARKFRNDVAHGSSEIVLSKKYANNNSVEKVIGEYTESKLEKRVNLPFAADAYSSAKDLVDLFLGKMDSDVAHEIRFSSCSARATPKIKSKE